MVLLERLTIQEKQKRQPDIINIENWQNAINCIENYKTQGTIIRSKEMSILNEGKPSKYFYQIEKQKQINQLQNEQNKLLTTNLEILKEWQKFYQKLHNKQKNCLKTKKKY